MVVHAELVNRARDILFRHKLTERLVKRRPDKKVKLLPVSLHPIRVQRKLRGLHNAGAGVGQRAVQIK